MATSEQFSTMMGVYGFPSQAFWRSFEFDLLKKQQLERPILEAGCSDGQFTRHLCGFVEAAIDINPRVLQLAEGSGVYGTVRLQDAGALEDEPQFRTVLFNSVIEHIPEPARVLAGSYRVLLPGGKLILTVPLVEMNGNLLLRSHSYIRSRQSRLCHVNLFTLDTWKEQLRAAGFEIEQTVRYLGPKAMRVWDSIDALTMLGTARVNVGSIAFRVRRKLPRRLAHLVDAIAYRILYKHLSQTAASDGCAAMIVALKPADTNGNAAQ